MVPDSWTIVSVFKGPGLLSDETGASLKMAACILRKHGQARMRFRGDSCEGVIETEWKEHLLGNRAGILFHAELDAEDGTYQVNFLLNEEDMLRGVESLEGDEPLPDTDGPWQNVSHELPVEGLYRFRNLRYPVH